MKIKRVNQPFQPIEIKITIETNKEVFNLQQLANHPMTIDDELKRSGCAKAQQVIMGFLVELGKQLNVD